MLSGPAAFPSVSLSFTLLYSSRVKGVVIMFKRLSLMVLISFLFISTSCSLSSSCLKCSYHLIIRSVLLFALIFPIFELFRPVILLISIQLSACFCNSLVVSTCLIFVSRIYVSIFSYSSRSRRLA